MYMCSRPEMIKRTSVRRLLPHGPLEAISREPGSSTPFFLMVS
jgi:hypothetical protein